mmetsp:Transcript_41618/g.99111  ORF Transcript_41618/g.99111 Transcript_41618/m.99111 type:complete len:845 (+) Transcript_41618:33-2567(+)
MAAGIRFVAELPVVIRRQPSLSSDQVCLLQKGDEITATDVFQQGGVEWVKLARGACALRSNGAEVPLDLREEGFIATVVPPSNTQLRRAEESTAMPEQMLSKKEISEVLALSSDPSLQLPLEAKYWTRQQLEMFVMSGGVLRPKNCSMPDERLLANASMSKEEIVHSLAQAAEWIASADALLIGSGAGMGVDAGLGTFRGGKKGVWDGLEAVGLAYEEICEPRWFDEAKGDPRLAWGFWNHCYKAYQETKPHQGYAALRQLGQRCPFGFFSFTSNIDSHWIASGMSAERVLEVHGAVKWLQCSKPCCPDVWKAPADLCLAEDPHTHRVQGVLPSCPKCKAVARPNVQMFGGDSGFSRARRGAQNTRYDAWVNSLASRPDVSSLSVVCLEVGCGLTVPTVRRELEKVVQRFPGGRLIRVNPENPGLAKELVEKGVSLPLPAAAAIEKLSQQVAQTEEIMQATYVLWGQEGGCEIRAPFGTCLGRLLRLVETQGRMTVEFKPDVVGIVKQAMGPRTEPLTLERSVPMDMYQEVKVGDGAKLEVTAIIRVMAKFSGGSSSVGGFSLNAPLATRVDQVCKLLDEVNHAFSQPEYQKAAEGCEDRRSLLKETRNIQFEVLPKYGIEATEKGTSIMAAWISSAQNGIKDVDDKVAASMHLSRIAYASKLPLAKNKAKEAVPTPAQTPQTQSVAVERAPFPEKKASAPPGKPPPAAPPKATPLGVATPPVAFGSPPWQPAVEKEEKPVEKKEPPKPKPKPKEEKPPQALTVTLTRFSTWEDPTPQRFQVELMSNTKVSELRAKIAELCALDDSETRKVKLIKRKKAGFVTAQETESVSSEVFVHQIEKWPK